MFKEKPITVKEGNEGEVSSSEISSFIDGSIPAKLKEEIREGKGSILEKIKKIDDILAQETEGSEADFGQSNNLLELKKILEEKELETPELLKIQGFVDNLLHYLERIYNSS